MPTASSVRARWLLAARLGGVWALGAIGQIAVDMPDGPFGPADAMTRFGAVYAALLTTVVALLILAPARHRWPVWTVPLVLAANVGLFLPALATDPVITGSVLLWNLYLLAQQLFPSSHTAPRHPPGNPVRDWLARYGAALRHLTAAALLLTVAVVGYHLSDHALTRGICLLLDVVTLALAWPLLRRLARAGQRAVWLLAAPLAASALAALFLGAAATPWLLAGLATAQLVLLLILVAQQSSTLEVLRDFYRRPSWLIFASFAVVILVGTVLLTFPAAAAGAQPISPLDALFTATSATCVTGLIVLDTPHDLSLLGQGILLALIQLGGLGIMVVSTFATLMLGGSLGMRGEQALSEMMDQAAASTAYRLTRFIVLATLAVEGVGAAVLATLFAVHGDSPALAVWRGVFHAVSAFCNAGFALQSDSLVGLADMPGAVLVFAVLIVLGGLGFAVLAALWGRAGRVFRRRDDDRRRGFNNQVKVVLAVSGILLAAGTALYAALEWRRSLDGLPVADRLVHSLFQSVTLRTAGFNSVDLSLLAPATVVFLMLFMFIGASPGSTGGGIKTTTVAVLLATLRGAVGGGEPPRLFNREIPRAIVLRSLAILLLSATLILLGVFLLLLFEEHDFLPLLFEVTSAFGTVGLSLGVTGDLGPVGKLLIVALMFVGRIGPLTLALLLGTGARRRAVVRYPESHLMVG